MSRNEKKDPTSEAGNTETIAIKETVTAEARLLSDLERGMKMLEYLEKGPWPSYVSELRKTKYPIEVYAEGLG
jgi:hypothetical protein